MDRLNQADLEKIYYAATQPSRILRHTRKLIVCYTLHKVSYIVTLTRDLLYSSAVKLL